MESRVLVTYSTYAGSTKGVAEAIARTPIYRYNQRRKIN
jgi:menaquinone-dependent protoporphyrinogen IX oxidase